MGLNTIFIPSSSRPLKSIRKRGLWALRIQNAEHVILLTGVCCLVKEVTWMQVS